MGGEGGRKGRKREIEGQRKREGGKRRERERTNRVMKVTREIYLTAYKTNPTKKMFRSQEAY